MIRLRVAALLLFLVGGVGCEHPTPEQCEVACQKVGEMTYWDRVNREVETLAEPDKTVRLEAAKEEWARIAAKTSEENPELKRCVLTCSKLAPPTVTACIEKAKDLEAVKKCSGIEVGSRDDDD